VGHVQAVSNSLELSLHVMIEVGMATDVEVARYFLHCKRSYESTAILVSKSIPNNFKLLYWILFS